MPILFEWIKKFLGGFNFSSSAVIGKWIFYAVIFMLFMTAYNRLNPPRVTQTITAEKVINQPENKKDFFFGIRIKRFGAGVFVE